MRRHTWVGPIARLVGAGALVAMFLASPAHALDDSPRDPLDRAAFSALPSVYRMTVTIRVDQFADDRRVVRIGRAVTIEGTAFGVGPGIVVTARPLVRPPTVALAAAVSELDIPGVAAFDPNDVRITSSVTSIVLRRASPGPTPATTTVKATVLQTTKATAPSKLALLRIPVRDAPALALDDSTTLGTPVVLVAFGGQRDTEPALQRGALGPAGKVEGSDDANLVTVSGIGDNVGDTGGPVLDESGHVRGVVIQRAVAPGESSVMTRSSGIRQLASNANVAVGTTPAQTTFADGMRSYWERDYTAASESLTFAADRLPKDEWVAGLATRAEELASADYEVVQSAPWRLPLILGGVVALAIALMLALRFWSMEE